MFRRHAAMAPPITPLQDAEREPASRAPRRWLWLWVGLSALLGLCLGALAMWAVPLLAGEQAGEQGEPPPLAEPAVITGSTEGKMPKVEGDLQTVMRSFTLEDLEGHTVLQVDKLSAFVDLDAMRKNIIRMPRGQASHVKVLLRRGKSGRVSLSEAVHGTTEAPKQERSATRLNIGPLLVKDVLMTVDMGDTPVVVHVSHARVRVQRSAGDLAPRVFLSEIRGNLQKPDPLKQPIAIRGAEGVVNLQGDPFVDIRSRVCIGNSEMKVRIEMPERRTQVQMTVEADGALAQAALLGLGLVSKIKSAKLAVHKGPVQVKEPFECSRAGGDDLRDEMGDRDSKADAEADAP
jgi:hypothetical protein